MGSSPTNDMPVADPGKTGSHMCPGLTYDRDYYTGSTLENRSTLGAVDKRSEIGKHMRPTPPRTYASDGMVDVPALEAGAREGVWVRVPPGVLTARYNGSGHSRLCGQSGLSTCVQGASQNLAAEALSRYLGKLLSRGV